MERILKSLTVVVVVALFLAFPRTSIAAEREEEGGFMTWLSTWNPIKDNFSKPLMENIPNFEIQGFIQNLNTLSIYKNVNKYRNIPLKDPAFQDTNTSWQRIEWLLELEPRYRLTPELQFVLKAAYLYNAAYDWSAGFRGSYGNYWSRSRLHHYRRATDILREYYGDYIKGPLQVRIGKQQVVWGRVDGRQILDMVHGSNYTRQFELSINPFLSSEYFRIPKWMANIQYFPGDFQFQFLWIPDFEPSFGPNWNGHLWEWNVRSPALPVPVTYITRPTKEPARSMDNSELGFMAKILREGWDVSIHYLYAFDTEPALFQDRNTIIFPTPTFQVVTYPEHKRLHKFGVGADKTWSMLGRQWAVKFEGRYIRNQYYRTTVWNQQNRGVRRADSLLTGLQIETYVLTNMGLILRYDHQQIFKFHSELATKLGKLKPNQEGIFFTVRKPIRKTYDRLLVNSLLVWVQDEGWRYEPVLTYELTEDFTLMLGGHFYWGVPDEDPSHDKPHQYYGQFRSHDGIDFGVKWNF